MKQLPKIHSEVILEFVKYKEDNYSSQRNIQNIVKTVTKFCGSVGKPLHEISKEDVLSFLNMTKKDKTGDPEQRWITTFNSYLGWLAVFFRWLHNKSREEDEWETPECVDIKRIKTKRLSSYSQSDIWTPEDVLLIVKYCVNARDKAVITCMYDLAGRNHEVTKLRIKDVVFNENYAEAMVNWDTKTGQRPIPLILSFTYVREWVNKHPFNSEPKAALFPSLTTWKPMHPDTIWKITNDLRKRIQNIVGNEETQIPEEERGRLKEFLQKKWNPYLLGRHSSLTEKAAVLPEFSLRKYAGWSATSKQPARYVHLSGREVKTKLLEHYGLAKKEESKVQTAKECPRCHHLNNLESRFCDKCTLALTIDAWQESRTDIENLSRRMDSFEAMMKQILAGNPNPIPPDLSR